MNNEQSTTTGNGAGNASTASSTENHAGIPTLRMELAVLGAYSNCSECRRISQLLNSTSVVTDTLLTDIRAHRAEHFAAHSYEDGTNVK